jgi:hypothetical protein
MLAVRHASMATSLRSRKRSRTQPNIADILSCVIVIKLERGVCTHQGGTMSPDRARYLTQFPLRLAKSLRESAKVLAEREGISLNHFISLAVTEKISRIEQQGEASPIDALSKQDDRIPDRSVDGN